MKWLAFLMAGHAFAASLPDLQATAGKLRAQRSEPSGWRGESPLLTEFKHQLRDWVESQLNGEIANPQSVSRELNKDLAGAGLTCPGIECEDQSALGYLGDIRLDRLPDSAGWLVLITSVGIACGNDESAYLYERVEDRWLRRFESEQNQYGEGNYKPQTGIRIRSALDSAGKPLVLTSGINPACLSSWQVGYFRLFRSGDAQPLMDRQHTVFVGEDDQEIQLRPDDVFIRSPGFVLHFKIEREGLRRIEPIATSPGLFVDEWRASPWLEVAEWSDSSLAPWHARTADPHIFFGFWDDIDACPKQPGHWQISYSLERQTFYFLVEEKGPSSYRMLEVSTASHAGCSP